jgi:hypothetical protein
MPSSLSPCWYSSWSPWRSLPACLCSTSARPRPAFSAIASPPSRTGRTSRARRGSAARRSAQPHPGFRHLPAPLGARLRPAENAGPGKRGCSRRKLPHAVRRFRRGLAVIAFIAGGNLLFGWVGACSAFSSPTPMPRICAPSASQKFEEKFPEAIDTLARAVRAGHAFTTALEMIANEVAEPVAGEFRQLYEEQKFGSRCATPCSIWPTAFRWSTSSSS